MNERIRELFESEVYPSFAGTIGTGLRRNLRGEYLSDNLEDNWQTFQEATELIVRECIDKITTYDLSPGHSAKWEDIYEIHARLLQDLGEELKEHFGVEE